MLNIRMFYLLIAIGIYKPISAVTLDAPTAYTTDLCLTTYWAVPLARPTSN